MKFGGANIGRVEIMQRAVARFVYNGTEVWSAKRPDDVLLNITPEDIVWITDTEGVLYVVESNTKWSVECKEEWIEVTPSQGSGNGEISVDSVGINEGIDRDALITFKGGSVSVERIVRQEGLREIFEDDFILADGGTFNVLKVGG